MLKSYICATLAGATLLFAQIVHAQVANEDILFHASFENVLNADKAVGSQKGTANKKIDFTADGIRGKALRLAQGDRLVYEQENNRNTKQGTVSLWIRPVDWDPAKQSKNYHWLFSMENNEADGARIQFFRMPSPLFMFMIGNNGKAKQLTATLNQWKCGEWLHAAMTWEAGKTQLYINGKSIVNTAISEEELPVNTGKDILLTSTSGTTDFDEFIIYKRALTRGEIEALYLENHPDSRQQTKYRPVIEAGKCAGNDIDWKNAAKVSGFLSIPELQIIPGTETKFAYSDTALHFRMETLVEGKFQKPETVSLQTLWSVPSAEIFVRTGTGEACSTWQLAFNMFGQKMTFKDTREISWDADVKAEVKGNKWITDVTIPYQTLGVKAPADGTEWLMNFGRNFIIPRIFSNPALCLAYGENAKWWKVIFRESPGAYVDFDLQKAENKLVWNIKNSAPGDKLSVLIKKLPMDLKNVPQNIEKTDSIHGILVRNQLKEDASAGFQELPGAGRYIARFRLHSSDGNLKYNQLIHFIQTESFSIQPIFLSKDKVMNVVCDLNMLLKDEVVLQTEILNKKGEKVAEKTLSLPPGKSKGIIPFDMSSWKELDYTIRTGLFINGKKMEERSRAFKCYYNAPWIGFEKRLGYEQKIPKPWIPLEIDGNRIRTLTQHYTLGEDGLPEAITAAGKQLLAEKIRLEMAGFKLVSKIKFLKKAPGEVVWESRFESKNASAVLKGTMEFDGMIRYDLTFSPKKKMSLQKLHLIVPTSKECGKYFIPYAGPYQTWTVLDMETDASKPYADAFMPHLWTGGDIAGIAWFAESDEFYRPADERKTVAISPNKKSTDMIIDMVSRDLVLEKPLTYTFGIQATPAKPLADKWFNWHFASCSVTPRKPMVTCGYTTGMDYHTYSGLPYPTKDDARALRYTKSAGHPDNYYLIYTTTNGIGSKCPEFQFFEQEWKNQKFCDTWTMAFRGEYHWGTNPNSQTYRDFYLWSAQQALDKFEPDGFYYDFGTALDVDDPAGDCVYYRDGKRRTTWTIFSDRAMRRALYQMVMDKRGRAAFIYHNYSKPFAPVSSFATMVLDGEPYQQKTGVIGIKVSTDYTELIPLSRFKTMFGIQFGAIPYFLAKLPEGTSGAEENVKATRTLLAMALPHGVTIWGFYCDINELNKALAVQDEFGIGESEFVQYYADNRKLTNVPEIKDKLLLSYWEKKNGEILAVAGNLSPEPYTGEIKISGKGSFKIEVPAKDFNFYKIHPDGSAEKL